MIEQALFFAIGFLVASLAAVVSMPVMSRRATRLARARAELNAPVTEKQAIAERDALRAVHAVGQVQLEHRLAAAEGAAVELRAAAGRQSVKIIGLEAESAERDRVIFDQRAEMEKAASERRDLEVALAASRIALHDAFAQRDRAEISAASLGQLEAEANRERARIAILTARTQNLEGRLEDLSRSEKAAAEKADAATAQLAAKTAQAEELEGRLREAIDRNRTATDTLSRAKAEQNETGRRLADLEARLHLSERTREETLIENGRLLAALADREADLRTALAKLVGKNAPPAAAAAQEDAAALEAQSESPAEAARRETRHGARADWAIHRENEALSASVAALGASAHNASDDTALRDSIERLGREISRLYAGQKLVARSDRVPGEPPSAEARGFAEASRRRIARSHASDR